LAQETKRETDAILWRTGSHPLVVDCPRVLLDELHRSAVDGFHRIARGGIEVGGVLFGRHQDNLVRILAWRPILCEYAKGPSFILSESDHAGLAQLLEAADQDPQLQVLEPVGWFVSHTRKGVELVDSDLDVYNLHFPEPWQVTLVVRPDKLGISTAGFFFREPDGSLRRKASYQEFTLESAIVPRSKRGEGRTERAAETAGHEFSDELAATAVDHSIHDDPVPRQREEDLAPPPSRRWPGWVAAILMMLFVVAAVTFPIFRNSLNGLHEPIKLRLEDLNGQLRVDWNRNARALVEGEKAEVQIVDGGTVQLALDQALMRSGSLNYARRSEDVTVRFIVYRKNKPPVEELARFVGPPVPARASKALLEAEKQRDALLQEAGQLREEMREEGKRTRQLEQAVKKLESKMQRQSRRK